MNQNVQINNLTKDVSITLDGKYTILPGGFITLTVLEYPQILNKINLQKQLGWIDWKFVPVDYSKQSVPLQEGLQPASIPDSISLLNNDPTVTKDASSIAEEKASELHPASPLISKKWSKLRTKQEGEIKTDDSKGTV